MQDVGPSRTGSDVVYAGAVVVGAPGVGSNLTHPAEPIQSSGQAWASVPRTTHWLPSRRPWVNPTTTRAGMPTDRAIRAIVAANCSQYPTRSSRKVARASSSEPPSICVE